ncbi:MAG: hypothetical protein H7282_08065 [Cytophagaceae bacterium]|nr:hypothetical protein [Cytophagaceae bacterium]
MEILAKLYRSLDLTVFEDGYGGITSCNYRYAYFLFMDEVCYSFYSIEGYNVFGKSNQEAFKKTASFDDRKTIENLAIMLDKGKQTSFVQINENIIKFIFTIQIANFEGEIIDENRIYEGSFSDYGTSLEVNSWNENSPKEIINKKYALLNI